MKESEKNMEKYKVGSIPEKMARHKELQEQNQALQEVLNKYKKSNSE
jgi:cell shape-determining protein MreC